MRVMRDRWECAAAAAIKQHHYGQAIAMLIKAHKLNEQLTVRKDENGEREVK